MLGDSAVLPRKLRDDPIIEAIFELRFNAAEQPEVVLGKLIDAGPWKAFRTNRLPQADIPAPIRAADPSLRFTPLLELADPAGQRVVKIGSNVISFHVVNKYCGWSEFATQLGELTAALFNSLKQVDVLRCGLRYINALVPDRHGVRSPSDLTLVVESGGAVIGAAMNLNYIVGHDALHAALVRIATPEFVQGSTDPRWSVLIDIDVTSPKSKHTTTADGVTTWLDAAHAFEKSVFFALLGEDITNALRED